MKHEMRRKDRLVSDEKAREIMEKAEYGIFMTADAEGQPYGVAVSHVVDGDKVYFHCAANKVCMNFTCNTFVDGENYTHRYESVVAEGIATIVEDRKEKYHALQLVAKKYAPASFKDSDDYILPKMDVTGVVRVDIETMSGKVNAR